MHQGRVIILTIVVINRLVPKTVSIAPFLSCLQPTILCLFVFFLLWRGTSASLSMSTLCQTRKRNFVNFISRDTAAKERIASTCTISFTNSVKSFISCHYCRKCCSTFLNSGLQASTRASSFTLVPNVIRETTANSPTMLWLIWLKSCWRR